MNKINSHKVGLVLGGFFALFHAVWALMVFMDVAKPFMDWIFGLHFMNFQYTISRFDFGNAFLLVIVAGVVGYVFGYVFGYIWNSVHRMAHS